MRIYSTYSEREFELIKEQAEQRGLRPAEYVRQLVLLALPKVEEEPHDMKELSAEMFAELARTVPGKPFIISSLFRAEVWASLTASEKRALAMMLSHHVRRTPDLEKIGELSSKVSQYRKVGGMQKNDD